MTDFVDNLAVTALPSILGQADQTFGILEFLWRYTRLRKSVLIKFENVFRKFVPSWLPRIFNFIAKMSSYIVESYNFILKLLEASMLVSRYFDEEIQNTKENFD